MAEKKKKELIKGPDTEVTTEVLDFIRAIDDYKKIKNRPFPTWSEVLEVLKQLGYRQVEDALPIEDMAAKKKSEATGTGSKSTASKSAKKASRKASTKKASTKKAGTRRKAGSKG